MPTESAGAPIQAVAEVLDDEEAAGLHTLDGHDGFARSVVKVQRISMDFLIGCAREGKRVVAYGAPGKGNTLLNHCGIRSGPARVHASTAARTSTGMFLPGTHIPIHAPRISRECGPTTCCSCRGTCGRRSAAQLEYVREWGGRLVVPIPELEIF